VRRALRAAVRVTATAAVFVGAVAGGALVHMGVPVVKRAVAARVNQVLASPFAGRIVIDRIGSLGPSHVGNLDAHVDDPQGRTVLRVTGASVRIATATLLRSLAAGGDIVVDLDGISVASADVVLDADDEGTLQLVRAFAVASPSPPSPRGSPGVRLTILGALLGHAHVHGTPAKGLPIDADVDDAGVALRVAPGSIDLEVAHASIVARDIPRGVTTRGTLDGRFAQPSPRGGDRFASLTWKGALGELAGTANATYDGGRIDAVVDVPSARPECVRALWAECPFGETTSARVEVHGTLPLLGVNARAAVGRGVVTAEGFASLGEQRRASLRVTATDIDAHALVPSAPPTDLSATADAVLTATTDGAARVAAALELAGGTVDATPVPPVTLTSVFARDASGALRGDADVAVHEPGAPVTGTLHLAPKGGSFELSFDAAARVASLEAVPRAGAAARGSAQATVHGVVDLGKKQIDARVVASAADIDAGSARLGDATLTARARGALDAPSIDADLEGGGLSVGSLRFERLRAAAHGSPARAAVEVALQGHGADFAARADVGLSGGLSLTDLLLEVRRNGESASAHAEAVRIAGSEVAVEDLDVDGLGARLNASVRASPGSLRVTARSRAIDLARLGRLTGVEHVGGRVALDVDATVRPKSAEGHVVLDLTQGSFGGWTDANAHVDAKLEDRRASGQVSAKLGDVGSIDVKSSSIEIGPAGPLVANSWRTAWGAVDATAHLDLGKLAAHLPKGTLPAARVSGALDVQARAARDSATDATPDVDVTARTEGLSLTGAPIPWRIDGLGVATHTHVDGHNGTTTFDASITDATGPLVALNASSSAVPYAKIFTPDEPLADDLLVMPFRATLTVPSRDIATLPAILGTRGLQGRLDARVDWTGAADQPTIDARVSLAGGKADPRVFALPFDLDLGAHYDGSHAAVYVRAADGEKRLLDVDASVDARAHDLFTSAAPPWKASAKGTLTDFPLQSLAAFDDRQVHGHASGTVKLDGLHEDAHASVALAINDLSVGDISCRPATLTATVDGKALAASARIVEEDGVAEATARLGARWGTELAPSVDATQPVDVSLNAKHFRAAVLLPFVAGLFTELDGRLDGNVAVHVDPTTRSVQPRGTIALNEGVVELSSVGNELHDVTGQVTLTPDGVVRVEHVTGRGLSGRFEAAATARFQGMDFAGARAIVTVPSKDPLPLVVDGSQIGTFDGHVDVAIDKAASGMDVTVGIPAMRLQLPRVATHDVQALGALPGVRTGVARRPGEFEPVPLGAGEGPGAAHASQRAPMRLTVRLGKDVEVTRSDLDVRLAGDPTITVGDAVTAKGQVRLTRGTLDVKGKSFKIDEGTITFVDDPTNPQVVLTASWPAPDGTTIFADFVGPLKTAKVHLRSEPSRSNDEILALLLFGTTDQSAASSTGDSAQVGAAQGVAGNVASEQLNEALSGVNGALGRMGLESSLTTKVDTSQSTPRPEVEVQIARDLTVQLAAVLGVPLPGVNPDRYLLTFGWRFLQRWSLEMTRGDQGTTILDVVWQHRY
jgi:translocation and assembly module TamB